MMQRQRLGSLVFGAFLVSAWSNAAMCDVDNFARRIGEANLQRHDRLQSLPESASQSELWATASYVSRDRGFRTDSGQIIVGLDHYWGSWLAGIAVGYGHTTVQSFYYYDFNQTYHEPAFAGYVSYLLNDTVFLNGVVGFEHIRSGDSSFPTDQEYQVPLSDLSINAVHHWGQIVLKGRIGHRLQYEINDSEPRYFGDAYSNTIYGFGEVGYSLGHWQPYFRTRIEERIFNTGGDSQLAFVGVGLTYNLSKSVDLGVVYERELNDEFTDYNQALLTTALRF
jgi:uncharacterized protein with beta-barrel porin domain